MTSVTRSYRIVLADDHECFRSELRDIINEMTDLRVVGEACNGQELLRLIVNVSPQMAILDISMPVLHGIETAHEIEQKHPHIKVLFLTMHRDDAYLRQAISVGAEGYVLKEHIDRDLYPAISAIRQGQVFFPGLC